MERFSAAQAEFAMPFSVARMGYLATRGQTYGLCTAAGVQQGASVSYHVSMDDNEVVQPLMGHVYSTGGVETAPGGDCTMFMGIEFPLGTARQLFTWGGQPSGLVPNGGRLAPDPITLANRAGQPYRIHVWRSVTAGGLPYDTQTGGAANVGTSNVQAAFLGDACQFGSTVPNVVASGVIGGTDTQSYFGPLAIIGPTKKRGMAIICDSLEYTGDRADDFTGDIGMVSRSVGPYMPYVKIGTRGQRLDWFLASHAQQLAVASYASDWVIGLGANDVIAGRTAQNIIDDTAAIIALAPAGTKVYTRTLLPIVNTSSDNFASVANQTVQTTYNPVIAAVNASRRALAGGSLACFDIGTFVSALRDGGQWDYPESNGRATSPVQYLMTGDGTHPTRRMYRRIGDARLVRPVN